MRVAMAAIGEVPMRGDVNSAVAIEGPVVQSILLVDRLTREDPGSFVSTSLPGHLIHVVTEGKVRQWAAGHLQEFGSGHLVWYYENEPVQGQILEAPWTFYTINFLAPTLAPPHFNHRVATVDASALSKVEQLLTLWRDHQAPSTMRHLRCFALLMELILQALPVESQSLRGDASTLVWWEVEAKLRKDLSLPIDLRYIEKLSGRSRRTINRACYLAVSMSPMRRVKEIRLSYARGLVLHSMLSMTEIAYRVGYSRVQELSRDYHSKFKRSPTEDRLSGPIYMIQQRPTDPTRGE
jgi:AraC-like DNA-binding protein